MNADEYVKMRTLEDHYWWFVGRRALALDLLSRAVFRAGSSPHPPAREEPARPEVLDLGCGTGAVLAELAGWAHPVGLDMSPIALRLSQERGLRRLVRGDGEALPLASSAIDGVIGLDIYEHIKDDRAALAETLRVLRPGGALVLSVPAFMSLWGPHDVALMHFRRYRARQMRRLLEDVGFRVERVSYSVFVLFPVVVIVRFFEKRRRGPARASLAPVPGWVNRLLIGVQLFERWWIRRLPFPWGSSVVVVARKPETT